MRHLRVVRGPVDVVLRARVGVLGVAGRHLGVGRALAEGHVDLEGGRPAGHVGPLDPGVAALHLGLNRARQLVPVGDVGPVVGVVVAHVGGAAVEVLGGHGGVHHDLVGAVGRPGGREGVRAVARPGVPVSVHRVDVALVAGRPAARAVGHHGLRDPVGERLVPLRVGYLALAGHGRAVPGDVHRLSRRRERVVVPVRRVRGGGRQRAPERAEPLPGHERQRRERDARPAHQRPRRTPRARPARPSACHVVLLALADLRSGHIQGGSGEGRRCRPKTESLYIGVGDDV